MNPENVPARRADWLRWAVPAAVALAALVAFLPTLRNGFVNWDDDKNFLMNPDFRGLGAAQLEWMWTRFHTGHYIPLSWMTLGLDHVLWGMDPFGYHLTNILLHALAAFLFYRVCLRLFAPTGGGEVGDVALAAGFAALLFAVHPLRAESVAWITQRRDVLSAPFFLGAVLLYLSYARGGGRRLYWGTLGLFAAALLSRETCFTLPAGLLVLDVYPLRRLGGAAGWTGPAARRVWLEKIPFLLMGGASAAAILLATPGFGTVRALDGGGISAALATALAGTGFQLWKTFRPFDLAPMYEMIRPGFGEKPVLLGAAAIAAATAFAFAARRRLPVLAAAWAWCFLMLTPSMGVTDSRSITFDRYSYLSGLGWAALGGAALLALARERRAGRVTAGGWTAGLAAALALVAGLGKLAWSQGQVWRDSTTLWTHVLSVDPSNTVAHNNLGAQARIEGRRDEAAEHFRKALEKDPHYADAHLNMGTVLADLGRAEDALRHCAQAAALDPKSADAQACLGSIFAGAGQPDRALAHYAKALELDPNLAVAHNNMGNIHLRRGDAAGAVEAYRRAVDRNPDFALAYNNMAVAYLLLSRWEDAARARARAAALDPDEEAERRYRELETRLRAGKM